MRLRLLDLSCNALTPNGCRLLQTLPSLELVCLDRTSCSAATLQDALAALGAQSADVMHDSPFPLRVPNCGWAIDLVPECDAKTPEAQPGKRAVLVLVFSSQRAICMPGSTGGSTRPLPVQAAPAASLEEMLKPFATQPSASRGSGVALLSSGARAPLAERQQQQSQHRHQMSQARVNPFAVRASGGGTEATTKNTFFPAAPPAPRPLQRAASLSTQQPASEVVSSVASDRLVIPAEQPRRPVQTTMAQFLTKKPS